MDEFKEGSLTRFARDTQYSQNIIHPFPDIIESTSCRASIALSTQSKQDSIILDFSNSDSGGSTDLAYDDANFKHCSQNELLRDSEVKSSARKAWNRMLSKSDGSAGGAVVVEVSRT